MLKKTTRENNSPEGRRPELTRFVSRSDALIELELRGARVEDSPTHRSRWRAHNRRVRSPRTEALNWSGRAAPEPGRTGGAAAAPWLLPTQPPLHTATLNKTNALFRFRLALRWTAALCRRALCPVEEMFLSVVPVHKRILGSRECFIRDVWSVSVCAVALCRRLGDFLSGWWSFTASRGGGRKFLNAWN